MEPRCRVALLKSRQALIRDLDVEPAVDRLLSDLVITAADSCKIRAERLDHNKRRVFLDLLPERGQKAFDVFLDHLSQGEYSQYWLRDSIRESLATVTQEELDKMQEEYSEFREGASEGGPTANELQQALRRNIEKYIANDPSKILDSEADSTAYINQPVTAHKLEKEKDPEKIPVGNISELLETCSPSCGRMFIYGAAGMGKSSLCRHIAQSWAQEQSKLSEQFDYVFPISMRSVRSHSLVDIICKDGKLIPESCKQRLEQELGLKSVLFILDSFEELSHETREITKLIRRELFPNCSVIITARPGGLEKDECESMPCIKVYLQNLTEEQVREYVRKYPGLQEDVQSELEERFGMSFLCRPVNLWLLCLLVTQKTSSADIPDTQTVLLNRIIQHLMVAYSKKKKLSGQRCTPELLHKRIRLSDFTPVGKSPLENAPTEVKIMLEKVGQLCYYGLRDNKRALALQDGLLKKADVMAMGLFSEGADDNSVTLPHPLFQEYLAALFLSVNKRSRDDLFRELKEASERYSPKSCLVKLLRFQGYDNMVRFLVGLLPEVGKDLSKLFVIRQVLLFSFRLSDLSYELGLLKECSGDAEKAVIVAGILQAPVTECSESLHVDSAPQNTDSHLLLHFLNREQRQDFLRKFYGCQTSDQELIRVPGSGVFWLDMFVLGIIYLNNCLVRMEHASFIHCSVPACFFTDRRLAVLENLTLESCTLCDYTEPQFLASLNLVSLSDTSTSVPLGQREVSLSLLELSRVRGLNFLSPPLPTVVTLQVSNCDKVFLGLLHHCFPGVTELQLPYNKIVYTSGDITSGQYHQWPSVTKMNIDGALGADLIGLKKTFVSLESMAAVLTGFRMEKRHLEGQTQWHTMKYLRLVGTNLGTEEKILSEVEVKEFLTRLCPQAEIDISGYVW